MIRQVPARVIPTGTTSNLDRSMAVRMLPAERHEIECSRYVLRRQEPHDAWMVPRETTLPPRLPGPDGSDPRGARHVGGDMTPTGEPDEWTPATWAIAAGRPMVRASR